MRRSPKQHISHKKPKSSPKRSSTGDHSPALAVQNNLPSLNEQAPSFSPIQVAQLSRTLGNRATTAIVNRQQPDRKMIHRKRKLWAEMAARTSASVNMTPEERAAELSRVLDSMVVDSMKNFEKAAQLLAGPDLTPHWQGHQSLETRLRSKFTTYKLAYLRSMLVDTNGSPIGEPSFPAEVMLSTGLVFGIAPSSDNKEILTLIHSASLEELRALKSYDYWDNIKARIARVHHGRQVADYIDSKLNVAQKLGEGFSRAGLAGHAVNIHARKEFLSLLSMIVDKRSTTRDSRLVTSDKAAAKIMTWAGHLRELINQQVETQQQPQDGGGAAPPGGNRVDPAQATYNEVIRYITHHDEFNTFFTSHKISDRHKNFIVDMLNGTRNEGYANSAESLLDYHRKKDENERSRLRGKGWHWGALAARIESMEMEERLKFLRTRLNGPAQFGDPPGLEEYIAHLDANGVPKKERKRIENAFKFGAAAGTTEKGSTYNLLRGKMGARHHVLKSTIRQLLSDLDPSEFLQVSRDAELMSWLVKRLGQDSKALAHLRNPDEGAPNLNEGEVIDRVGKAGIMRVSYWVEQLDVELGKKISGRTKIFTLVTQAWNTARQMQVLPFNKNEYPDDIPQSIDPVNPEQFLQDILAGLKEKHRKKLRTDDALQGAFQALSEGRPPTSFDLMMAASKKFHQFGWLRGAFITPSKFMKMIEATSGQQLLSEWTNFRDFIAAAREFSEARDNNDGQDPVLAEKEQAARERLRSWVLAPDPRKVAWLRRALPANMQFDVTRDLMLRLADAMEKDPEFQATIKVFEGGQADKLEAERMRGMAHLVREQAVNTGLQVQWFSSKAPERREAARLVTGRLRSVNEKIRDVDLGQERDPFEDGGKKEATGLEKAREKLERRTEAFEKLKERVVEGSIFVISILLGIAVSVATMGTAAPLIAAGLTAMQAQFLIALTSTLVASTAKELIKWGMVGTLHNNREIVFNIVKSVAMATTTVGAGEISGIIHEGSSVLQDIEQNASSAGFAFAEKFLNVSPVEVAMRTFAETVIDQVTAIEPDDRPIKSWSDARDLGLRFVSNTTLDALLKGTYDMMTGTISTDVGANHFAQDESGEDWIPDLKKVSVGEALAVILGENIVTAQNYSVAEQDALIPMLIEKYGMDKVGEAWTRLVDTERLIGKGKEEEEEGEEEAPQQQDDADQEQEDETMGPARDLFKVALTANDATQLRELHRRGLGISDLFFFSNRLVGAAAASPLAGHAEKIQTLQDMGFPLKAIKLLGFPLNGFLANGIPFADYSKEYSFREFLLALRAEPGLFDQINADQLYWSTEGHTMSRKLAVYRIRTNISLNNMYVAAVRAGHPFSAQDALDAGFPLGEIIAVIPDGVNLMPQVPNNPLRNVPGDNPVRERARQGDNDGGQQGEQVRQEELAI